MRRAARKLRFVSAHQPARQLADMVDRMTENAFRIQVLVRVVRVIAVLVVNFQAVDRLHLARLANVLCALENGGDALHDTQRPRLPPGGPAPGTCFG